MDWYVVGGGGTTTAASTGYRAGLTIGQTLAGASTSTHYRAGFGFWYGLSGGAGPGTCPVTETGNVNALGDITAGDVIYLVNYVFKAGPEPLPCPAAGDVNCSEVITAADIIYLVNYVFKGGPPPCDVCALIPDRWSCP
jgi:hypothetical protein